MHICTCFTAFPIPECLEGPRGDRAADRLPASAIPEEHRKTVVLATSAK